MQSVIFYWLNIINNYISCINILNIINDKFQLDSDKELIFLDEIKSLDEKNRFLLPSKIKNLFSWSEEILSLKISKPYQHIVLLPYQDELKKMISGLDMSYSNALLKNPISSIKMDSKHRIIIPQECLKQWDRSVQIIWEKYRIRIFSDSIYKSFCEKEIIL